MVSLLNGHTYLQSGQYFENAVQFANTYQQEAKNLLRSFPRVFMKDSHSATGSRPKQVYIYIYIVSW